MGRRKFTAEFKRKVVVQAMRGDETVRTIAARGTVRVTGSDKYNLQSRALRLPVGATPPWRRLGVV